MNVRFSIVLFFLIAAIAPAFGLSAPGNNDCSSAILLKNVRNYCSSPRQYTTYGATSSRFEKPLCFPSYLLDPDNDVWFKFKAVANTVNISVIGAIEGNPKGTLQYPQFALYIGTCSGGLLEVGCISDPRGFNLAETFINNLAIGGTYYLRVDGRQGHTGSFQLCINNFNPIPSPSSDCASAVVLCDKSSFTVPNISGVGFDNNEIPPGNCLHEESSSAWYKWTCDEPGTLSFTLKPVNPSDDIDFALFLLPNGVEDCSDKILYRCMASGEQVSTSFSQWARCSGTTGLRGGSADFVEEAGCQPGDDNFLAPIRMGAGESYALLVNNYHNTGNGFSIEFGGTGTFKGPVAHFVVNKLKINQDQELWVKNKSSFEGGIKKWEWNFGVDAKPGKATGKGPHKVRYSSSGKKSISLAIETGNGCKVTKVRQVTVTDPPPKPVAPPAPVAAPTELSASMSEEPEPPAKVEKPITTPPTPPAAAAVIEKKKTITSTDSVTYDVKYTATIYFQSDSSSLDQDDFEILKKVLKHLHQHPDFKAIVEGHTNNIPDSKYCNKLAAERAGSVITWLNDQGIADDRIVRKVFGKDKVRVKEDKKYKNRKVYQKAVIKVVQRE